MKTIHENKYVIINKPGSLSTTFSYNSIVKYSYI